MTRLRSPLNQRGAHTKKWAKWHEHSRMAVRWRSQYRCEGCGDHMKPLEWAHLAGRGHIIEEPWCSTPELTVGLCSGKWGALGCHEKVDRALAPNLLAELRWKAVERLCETHGVERPVGDELRTIYDEPLDAIRGVVRMLEMAGWEWDGKAIVRLAEVVRL